MKFKIALNEVTTFKGFILVIGGITTIFFLIYKDRESAEFILGATVTLAGLVGVGISDKEDSGKAAIARIHKKIDKLAEKVNQEHINGQDN